MIGQPWQVAGGEVRVAIDDAEWWAASLAVLHAAIHHPRSLAAALPETDPVEVAAAVLAEVADLYAAAAIAEGQAGPDSGVGSAWVSVRRVGAEMVFAPGAVVSNLARCLEVFAIAALDPSSPDATVARGATAYAAAAWSADIRKASKTLGGTEPPGEAGSGSGPSAVDGVQHRRAAPDHGTNR